MDHWAKKFQQKAIQAVEKNRVKWQRHTLQRMMERDILREEVKQVLQKGEIIETYPDDYPLPSALFLGYTKDDKPLHVVAAVDSETNRCYIVTVYWPDAEHFEPDFKTRKK